MQLYKHPILMQGFNVVQAIEECGASEKLTHAVILAGEYNDEVEKLVDAFNDPTFLAVNILRNWDRDKTERFARHLLGTSLRGGEKPIAFMDKEQWKKGERRFENVII